jgi:hypothetical protein
VEAFDAFLDLLEGRENFALFLLYGHSQRPLDLCDTLAARHGGMD